MTDKEKLDALALQNDFDPETVRRPQPVPEEKHDPSFVKDPNHPPAETE